MIEITAQGRRGRPLPDLEPHQHLVIFETVEGSLFMVEVDGPKDQAVERAAETRLVDLADVLRARVTTRDALLNAPEE